MSIGAPGADPKSSPTLTMGETVAGVIPGTAAYMVPEQACRHLGLRRGAARDAHRWLAVRRPDGLRYSRHGAEGRAGLEHHSAPVRPTLERRLYKDRRRRWHCIGDVRMALEEGLQVTPVPPAERGRSMPWAIAAASRPITCRAD